MQQSLGRRRILIGMVAMLALLGGTLGGWRITAAQSVVQDAAPFADLAGLQQAIERHYYGESIDGQTLEIYANIARFDTAENATTGLDVLNAYYLDAYTDPALYYRVITSPLVFEAMDADTSVPGVLAYHTTVSPTPDGFFDEAVLVQALDGVQVYTIFALVYASATNTGDIPLDAALVWLEAMTAAPAGAGTPEVEVVDGDMTGGTWITFPAADDEVLQPYGIYSSADTVWFGLEPLPEGVVAAYGDVEGLESVVARGYGVLDSDSGEPQDVPTAFVELAAFDEAASAGPGFATATTAQLVELGLDGVGLEKTEADVPADEAVAYAAEVENEGEQYSVAVIVSRSGPYVVTVAVITVADEDALALAEDLSQAVIEADAGTGAGTFSDDGTSSGGVWDKLPGAGDEVLRGMEPVGDSQYYPEPDDAS